MLLIYTHKITPRFRYTMKQVFTRILGIEISFTTKVEDFIKHSGAKITYTKQPLQNEFFVRSNDLLFEQGINDLQIVVNDWDGVPCFFRAGERSSLPFDIFSASFYLLSRYEEYLPHVKDIHERFPVKDSIAYKNKFLRSPVVDIWAYRFKDALQKQYPDFIFPKKSYKIQPVIDVPSPYAYKLKGVMRTSGGLLKDFFRLRLKQLYHRFAVLFGLKHDPYDTFKYIINRQKYSNSKFLVLFFIGSYSTFDKGININKRGFTSLIKHVADYCDVGLKASYFSVNDIEVLKKEKRLMEEVINTSLKGSRYSFSKFNLPESYRNMVQLEIKEDYTMGYINHIGFRAGACTPFLFYDLDYEVQTPLKICPFHLMDFALLKHASLLDKKKALNTIIDEIKSVNGTFVPVFHNYTFSSVPRWNGFKELFNIILDSVDEEA